MESPTLIFCGGNNPHFAKIAIDAGFLYGARLPCSVYGTLYFADQEWKNPNRTEYMQALSIYRPYMASVMDWEREDQLPDVLSWAEEAAHYAQEVMIIPKVHNGIYKLPRSIGGKTIRLGYSVPTNHGGTDVHTAEFIGWPVHLLGGSPGRQKYYSKYLDTKSADGNMALKMANKGLYWVRGKSAYSNRWVSLIETDGKRWNGDGNYEAFRRSCENIMQYWGRI